MLTFDQIAGAYTVRWALLRGAGAYELQMSTANPVTEASFATVYVGKHVRFVGSGAVGTSGAVRIRSIGLAVTPSAWSTAVPFVLR